ncbi:MAG: metalloregulator ArsR/SmtB family transcription factor [Solirubrobacteraceae bacterium]|jgi:DNA-binding transcriptional ArsR family regulator
MMTGTWTEPVVDLVTSRLALLADPTRVQLLTLLEGGETPVQQICDKMPSTPQNVSRHLCILHRAGIVTRRRDGNSVLYSLADYSACRLLEQTLASIRGQIDELADLVGLAA